MAKHFNSWREVPIHFKSKVGYRKWLAYGHMHVKGFGKKHREKIVIAGKPHKVKHKLV